jgi:hypothetical protein
MVGRHGGGQIGRRRARDGGGDQKRDHCRRSAGSIRALAAGIGVTAVSMARTSSASMSVFVSPGVAHPRLVFSKVESAMEALSLEGVQPFWEPSGGRFLGCTGWVRVTDIEAGRDAFASSPSPTTRCGMPPASAAHAGGMGDLVVPLPAGEKERRFNQSETRFRPKARARRTAARPRPIAARGPLCRRRHV